MQCPDNYIKINEDNKNICKGMTEYDCSNLGLVDCSVPSIGRWDGNCASSRIHCTNI